MRLLLLPLISLVVTSMTQAASYTAERVALDSLEVIRLTDPDHATEVSIAPSVGNNAYDMKVKGKPVFWFPYKTLGEFKTKRGMVGNPFLAPWANRIDQDAYYANGKRFLLNPDLGNLGRDPNGKPIHGLLVSTSEWKVTSLKANDRGAEVTSRLEFWRYPEWMAQFPFAHTIEMTYRLQDGVLEVETALENHSTQPMPVAIGYHPYFRLNDAPRDQWKVHLAARDRMLLSDQTLPTGEKELVNLPDPVSLQGTQLDDVFSGLLRGPQGRAEFWVEGKSERISVVYGPKYTVAVVYAPKGQEFICFEPMSAVTNAFNLAHAGLYQGLQTVPPGGTWKESFWVRPSGY